MKEQDLVIGKYTLESLTNGMYSSPLDLYREYIQNSVDSIDEGIKKQLDKEEKFFIDINVNLQEKYISIYDNGVGISYFSAVKTLL